MCIDNILQHVDFNKTSFHYHIQLKIKKYFLQLRETKNFAYKQNLCALIVSYKVPTKATRTKNL